MKHYQYILFASFLFAMVCCKDENSFGDGYQPTLAYQQDDTTNTTLWCPNHHHPHVIDMGDAGKWACCNVGASSPEEYGDYFAWGETSTKTKYDWSTYKWCNGSYDTMTKYCDDSSYGTVDNKTQLELSDDAACVNWGGSWRMPSIDEFTNLNSKCTWTWIIINNVQGYKVSASNGNSIFLPAAGYRGDYQLKDAGSLGCYWSSSLYANGANSGQGLGFYSSNHWTWVDGRFCGQNVRPVTE